MPLFKLQTVGRRQVDFPLRKSPRKRSSRSAEGRTDCFRRFYGIVLRALGARVAADMVSKLNPKSIRAPLDLAEFMFGSERNQWPGIRSLLREIQGEKCFYCDRRMVTGNEELDHFVPWSMYPNDPAHNFVLACPPCNAAKGNNLAPVEARDRWIERNTVYVIGLLNRRGTSRV